MTSIIGRGVLEPYSQTAEFSKPVSAASLPEIMKLPEPYHKNIIAVRNNKVLSLNELLYDGDEIIVFISAMGG